MVDFFLFIPTRTRGAHPRARPGAPFSTGWYKQLGLNDPIQSRLADLGLLKPGLEVVSQPGLLPSPALVHVSHIGPPLSNLQPKTPQMVKSIIHIC
jgi:hypothetical protein